MTAGRSLLSVGVLLAVLFIAAPATAHAQIIFDVQLSDRGREAITDPDRMDAPKLLGLLTEEGRHSYEGEEPVMAAKDLVFIVGEHGEIRHRSP